MIDRAVNAERLLDLIETGEIKYKDEFRIWIFKTYEDRNDNLICTAAALESALVVKTVMHHFEIT